MRDVQGRGMVRRRGRGRVEAGVVVVEGGCVVVVRTEAVDFPLESTANQSFSTPCPLA